MTFKPMQTCFSRILQIAIALFLFHITSLPSYSTDLFEDPKGFDAKFVPSMIELTIPFEGDRMTGLFYSAAGEGSHPTIILLHAFPGFEKNLDMAQALRRQGYNILFFHYRGTWGSGGSYSWSNSLQDVYTAIAYLKTSENLSKLRVDPKQIMLVGHSWGGMLSLKAGGHNNDIKCIVSLAPEDWTQWLDTEADRKSILEYLDGIYSVQGNPSAVAVQDLIDQRAEWSLENIAAAIGDKKVLLINAELDTAFNTKTRQKITALAKNSGTTDLDSITIEGADHSFSAKRIELIQRTANWLHNTCLSASEE